MVLLKQPLLFGAELRLQIIHIAHTSLRVKSKSCQKINSASQASTVFELKKRHNFFLLQAI